MGKAKQDKPEAADTATALIDVPLGNEQGRIESVHITLQEHHRSLFRRLFVTLKANHATYCVRPGHTKHIDAAACVWYWIFDQIFDDQRPLQASGMIDLPLCPDDGKCHKALFLTVARHCQRPLFRLKRALKIAKATYRSGDDEMIVNTNAGVCHWLLDQIRV